MYFIDINNKMTDKRKLTNSDVNDLLGKAPNINTEFENIFTKKTKHIKKSTSKSKSKKKSKSKIQNKNKKKSKKSNFIGDLCLNDDSTENSSCTSTDKIKYCVYNKQVNCLSGSTGYTGYTGYTGPAGSTSGHTGYT